MKTLFLVRHAKASHAGYAESDRDRPLNERGLQDAPRMGARLAARGVKPDLIVASPAVRALTTARLIAEALGVDSGRIVVDDQLYASSAQRLLAVVHALDDRHERVMLVGHNPEFSDLARQLSRKAGELTPCAVAELHYDAPSWALLGTLEPVQMRLDEPPA